MCYSVESSLKTTLISFVAIIYLLLSKIPHFQWYGIILIGWCGMQFVEMLLWMTNPRTSCTLWNKIITMSLIPFVLALQPLGSLWGSLFVIPWKKSTEFRKKFMIFYSIFILLSVLWVHYFNIKKTCTVVTNQGHLHWNTSLYLKYEKYDYTIYFIWLAVITLPLYMFWSNNKMMMFLLVLAPLFGFFYGIFTDGAPSIWCYYTSYTSYVACILLLLYQTNIYKII
jgi:hypothetical protein